MSTPCTSATAYNVHVAGQYNEAAWSVVQLRKVLESNSGSADTQAYPDIGQVQTACSHCEQVLSEVSKHFQLTNQHRTSWLG